MSDQMIVAIVDTPVHQPIDIDERAISLDQVGARSRGDSRTRRFVAEE